MNALTANSVIDEFAASVRRALGDLPVDEVDELTDGLEADLADRVDETDVADLGDAVAYADELRGAAGLPARTETVRRPLLESAGRAVRQAIASRPWLTSVVQFFVALRPLWWVYRGLAIAAIVAVIGAAVGHYVPQVAVVLAIVGVIVSVQFGRGRWLPRRWGHGLVVVASVVSVVAGVIALGNVGWLVGSTGQTVIESPTSSGLTLNGSQVTNIFAYDATGSFLSDVQLYDQNGNPLNVSADPSAQSLATAAADGSALYVLPNKNIPGRLAWNVYPLSVVAGDLAGDLADGDGTTAQSHVPLPPTPTVLGLVGASSDDSSQ